MAREKNGEQSRRGQVKQDQQLPVYGDSRAEFGLRFVDKDSDPDVVGFILHFHLRMKPETRRRVRKFLYWLLTAAIGAGAGVGLWHLR